MSNNRNLGNIATAITNATSGQVLTSQGNGVATFADAGGGSSVTTVTNVSGASDSLTAISSPDVGDIVFVTSTNGLFIRKSNGWFKIADVSNEAPNSLTGVSDSALAIDGTATTITLAATDPEGLALTFSAAAKTGSNTTFSTALTDGNTVNALNGSTIIATVEQQNNVFTIDPNTASNDGTVDITFSVTDGINTALTDDGQFTLAFVTIVTDSKYTTLLATATGTSDNNNITDSSSNSHSITVNGDAHAGTFSPYRSGGYSTYFDGSGDHIRYSDASLAEGTDDFTVEFWVKRDGSQATNDTVVGHDTTPGYQVAFTSNALYFHAAASDSTKFLGTGVLNDKQWYHVVYQRSSGTLQGFLDGVSLGTQSVTTDFTNSIIEIGMNRGSTAYFKGHVRDVRIIKGTAFYSSSGFDVPTEGLTAVSGTGYSTTLLSCHLPYIADGGANSLAPTINGDPETKLFSPYDYENYLATDHGGSVYFDGNGDYLKIDNVAFSGDLTFECWFNQTVAHTSSYQCVFSSSTYGSGVPIRFYTRNDDISIWVSGSGGPHLTTTFQSNVWYHVAVVRYSGTWTLYVNGKSVDTTTTGGAYDFSSTVDWSFGGSATGSYPFTGYVSDVRFTDSRVYTADFAPPAAPLATSSAKFHIKGTDASIIDKSQGANLKLEGNTTGSTDQVRTGNWVNTKTMKFNGSGDYISIPADDSIFSKDYTIEFWMYPTQDTNLLMPFSKGVGLQIYHQSGNIGAAFSWNNSSYSYNGNFGSITTNAWSHISLVRESSANTYKFYINGTLENTINSSSNISAGSANWIIGGYQSGYNFQGYLQDLRITEGLARYTANFTPPTAPLEG